MRSFAGRGTVRVSLALSLVVRRTYNVHALQIWWKTKQDGFIGFDANPVGLMSGVATHVRRVAAVFSGGPTWWATLRPAAALVALAMDAVRRRSAVSVRAWYLLLLLFAAVAASIISVLPFGPTTAGGGARLSVWLMPIFAIGSASALGLSRAGYSATPGFACRVRCDRHCRVRRSRRYGAGGGPSYPAAGSRSATQFIEKALKPGDGVFIEVTAGMYPYAIASGLHPVVQPTPRKKIAFAPEFADRRLHYLGFTGRFGERLVLTATSDAHHKTDIERAVGRADRVFLVC